MLASKGENTFADITKRVGYGRRAIFRLQRAKAPDEMDMYQEAQSIIRLHNPSLGCTEGVKRGAPAMSCMNTR
eukprot:5084850-Karenia_brevis.AAC.1